MSGSEDLKGRVKAGIALAMLAPLILVWGCSYVKGNVPAQPLPPGDEDPVITEEEPKVEEQQDEIEEPIGEADPEESGESGGEEEPESKARAEAKTPSPKPAPANYQFNPLKQKSGKRPLKLWALPTPASAMPWLNGMKNMVMEELLDFYLRYEAMMCEDRLPPISYMVLVGVIDDTLSISGFIEEYHPAEYEEWADRCNQMKEKKSITQGRYGREIWPRNKTHVNYPAAQAAGLRASGGFFVWGTFACVFAGPGQFGRAIPGPKTENGTSESRFLL